MKKLSAVAMTATIVLGLAGHSQKNGPAPAAQALTTKETSKEKVTEPEETTAGESAQTEKSDGSLGKILFLQTRNSNSFTSYMEEVFVKVANENGFKCGHLTVDSDEARQLSQIEQGITSKEYAGIVYDCAGEDVALGFREAKKAGVFVMTLREGAEDNTYIDCVVTCSLAQTRYEAIGLETKELGEAFNLAIVNGSEGRGVTVTIRKGYDKALAECPNINVAFDGTGNWNAGDTMALTETWFSSGTKIDGVVCMNDGMIAGVQQVMKDGGVLGALLIYSNDCELDTLDAIEAGKQKDSFNMNVQSQCEAAVEAMKTLVTGGTLKEKEIYVDPPLVMKENLQEYRESHGRSYQYQIGQTA